MSKHCACCEHEHEHEHMRSHEHEHEHTHSRKRSGEHHHDEGSLKETIIKLVIAAAHFAASFFFSEESVACKIILIISFLIVGFDVIKEAVEELFKEHSIDECFLMTIASVGAIAIGEAREAAAVMIFYTIGEMLEGIAEEHSRKSVTALLDLRPDTVKVQRNGKLVLVAPEEVSIGETVSISAGERIALDGVIINGNTEVDNAALTGESLPISLSAGDTVFGGGINLSGTVDVKVTKIYGESSGARILELVENAQSRKAKTERFISRFARTYTLAVVVVASVVAFVCPVFTGYSATFLSWLYKGLALLVSSCPCAVVISAPLSFFAGIGCASRNGILIKGSGYMELLAKAKTAAFDKTGTLTNGKLTVDSVSGGDDTLRLCAICESRSNHPIARAIVAEYGKDIPADAASSITERSGRGVMAEIDGRTVYCGNGAFMAEIGLHDIPKSEGKTTVYVADNSGLIGVITLSDTVRKDTPSAITELKALGVDKTVMLTGDNPVSAKAVCEASGLDGYSASLSPADKVSELSKLIETTEGTTVYTGDGINDSPVIALADVGIAMGGLGSDAAIETADIVILDDNISKLPLAVRICRRTVRIAYENIAFALLCKLVVIVLILLGLTGMWAGVFADVGVTVIAVLNSLRALHYNSKTKFSPKD